MPAAAIAAVALLPCVNNARAGDVYDRVSSVFGATTNRLPGTAAYHTCIDAVERELRAAGLQPHRQTFNTLVPHKRVCRFTVDGSEVTVFPLAPNGAFPVTT